jgi:hemerythrin
MSAERWSEEIGDARARMEAEHRAELELLDALSAAVATRAGTDRVQELLRQLLEHTNLHFLSEQLLMRLTAYPGMEAHEHEHDELMARARQLQAHVEAGDIEPTTRAIASMRTWLTGHMAQQDAALARYLSS